MQIVVLGMHRSGTSMVTRLINMMGAYFGPEKSSLGYAPDNPKGFWERRDVMEFNDRLLQTYGCTWDKLHSWPFGRVGALPDEELGRLKNLVMDMDAFRPWVLKDPRLCLTFPCWKPVLEVPVPVIVQRDPAEIARSLEMRDRLPLLYSIALWEYHAVGLLNATLDMSRVHVQMADVLADPVAAVERLFMAFEHMDVRGLRRPSAREIMAFMDPSLHRAEATEQTASITLTPHQRALDSCLKGETTQHKSPFAVSETSLAAMEPKSKQITE